MILDNVGAKYLAQNLDALAVGGRLFIIGLMGGAVAELNLGTILLKRLTISGTSSLRGSRMVLPSGIGWDGMDGSHESFACHPCCSTLGRKEYFRRE